MTTAPPAAPARSGNLRRTLDWCARRPFTTAALIYLIVSGIRFMTVWNFSEWDDVFVLAGRCLRDGLDLYARYPLQDNHLYTYPPFFALVAVPFTYVSLFVSRLIWFFINAICLVLMWRFAWTISGGKKMQNTPKPQWAEFFICILGLACGMRFVEDTLEHQQIDLVIAAFVLGGCFAWLRGRDWIAATCWGLAAAAKGPPLLFAAYLIWRRRWAAAIWMTLLAVGVNLLPDLVSRPARGLWAKQWVQQVVLVQNRVGDWYGEDFLNQSLAGAAHRYVADSWAIADHQLIITSHEAILSNLKLKAIVYGTELIMLAASILAAGKIFVRKIDPWQTALECAIVVTLMLLLSPMSHKTHFCILILPGLCTARLAIERRSLIAWLMLLICLTLVIALDRNFIGRARGDLLMWYGSVTWGTVALWLACLWGLARNRKVVMTQESPKLA